MRLSNFSIYELEEYTSKIRLQSILGCSSRTLAKYHNLAKKSIGDFYRDYPQFPSLDEDGDICDEAYTRVSLTKYQCWVIICLMMYSQRLPVSKISSNGVLNKKVRESLTKDVFNKFQQRQQNQANIVLAA